jgi:hypothetical protein
MAFLAEACFHIITIPLLTHPSTYMSLFVLAPPSVLSDPFCRFMTRVFAAIIIFGMTPGLLYGLRNTKSSTQARRSTYILLAGTEVYFIPFLLVELAKGGDVRKGAVLSVKMTIVLLGALGLPLMFRLYALFVRPEMMGPGNVKEVGSKKRE